MDKINTDFCSRPSRASFWHPRFDRRETGRNLAGPFLSVCIPVHPWLNSPMNYWLVKSEPAAYSWSQLVKDGKTAWTGVRNFAARLNLRAMKKAMLSASITASPTSRWSASRAWRRNSIPTRPPRRATGRAWIWSRSAVEQPSDARSHQGGQILKEMKLVRQSRLSVIPVTPAEFARLLALAGTKI